MLKGRLRRIIRGCLIYNMALYTKCILKEKYENDGIRISVMSRHTLNDGVTPDLQINEKKYDEHFKILAPPDKLVGDYYKRGLSWSNFEKSYLNFLRSPEVKQYVVNLTERALLNDITLLCIEETPEKCHRRLLAEECQRYNPFLSVK